MFDSIEDRVLNEAYYIIKNKATIRKCAAYFKVSKSTVHNDLSMRLEKLDYKMYLKVRKIIEINKMYRHIRGGMATKKKYRKLQNEK